MNNMNITFHLGFEQHLKHMRQNNEKKAEGTVPFISFVTRQKKGTRDIQRR